MYSGKGKEDKHFTFILSTICWQWSGSTWLSILTTILLYPPSGARYTLDMVDTMQELLNNTITGITICFILWVSLFTYFEHVLIKWFFITLSYILSEIDITELHRLLNTSSLLRSQTATDFPAGKVGRAAQPPGLQQEALRTRRWIHHIITPVKSWVDYDL